jgi:hypothetical protein
MRNFQCIFCPSAFAENFLLMQHLSRTHVGQFDIRCTEDNCGQLFATWRSFQTHISTRHRRNRIHNAAAPMAEAAPIVPEAPALMAAIPDLLVEVPQLLEAPALPVADLAVQPAAPNNMAIVQEGT